MSEAQSDAAKRLWADPSYRAKMRRTRERNRERKAKTGPKVKPAGRVSLYRDPGDPCPRCTRMLIRHRERDLDVAHCPHCNASWEIKPAEAGR